MRPFVVLLLLALCSAFCTPEVDAQLFRRGGFSMGSSCANGQCSGGSCGQSMSSFTLQPSTVYSEAPPSMQVATAVNSTASVNASGHIVTPSGKVVTELYGIPIVSAGYMETRIANNPPISPLIGAPASCECNCDCTPAIEELTVKIAALTKEVKNLKQFYGEKPEPTTTSTPPIDPIQASIARLAAERAIVLARLEEGSLVLK